MNAIEYEAFSVFYDTVLQLVAPEDLGEELVPYFRDQIGNALADIQTLIPWFRGFNVDVVEKGIVDDFCNASVFQGPVGKVAQLFAFKPGFDCTKYYYRRVSTAAIDCWMERQRCLYPPDEPPEAPVCLYDYNYVIQPEAEMVGGEGGDIIGDESGNVIGTGPTAPAVTYSAQAVTDEDDCIFKALDAKDRIFAVGPDYKIYAAPRFPCGYNLLVQSQGVRRKWGSGSLVPVDQQLREAVVNFVEHKMAMKERNSAAMSEYFTAYTMNLRTLKYRYFEEQETGPHRDCSAGIEQLMSAHHPLYATSVVAGDYRTTEDGEIRLTEDGEDYRLVE